jgi:hypothetical protein
MPSYESTQVGPRAKINFTSPFLEDRFMAIDGLDLQILEADITCALTSRGSISVSIGAKTVTSYVWANRRAYFSIWQRSSGMLGSSDARLSFSFVPEDGAEYTIEHIDNPGRLRVQVFNHGQDGKKSPFQVQNFSACNK